MLECTGLRLVASRGTAVAPDGLAEFVTQYAQRELVDNDGATALLEEMRAETPEDPTQFTDSAGNRYAVFPLSCIVGGERRCAGIAAVSTREGPAVLDAELVQALANHLVSESVIPPASAWDRPPKSGRGPGRDPLSVHEPRDGTLVRDFACAATSHLQLWAFGVPTPTMLIPVRPIRLATNRRTT